MTAGTSREAADRIGPRRSQIRERIRNWIRDNGPATVRELERGLDLTHQTVQPRITELMKSGDIMASGEKRRPWPGARPARVYRLVRPGEVPPPIRRRNRGRWDPQRSKRGPSPLAERVHNAIRVSQGIPGRQGATMDEICQITGLLPQTASARITELRRFGLIRDSDRRRPGASGYDQTVWLTTGATIQLGLFGQGT